MIGSKCYVHTPQQIRRKIDKKAQKGYLVDGGYDGEERYRIYIPEIRTTQVSRDVKFEERIKSGKNEFQISSKEDSETTIGN